MDQYPDGIPIDPALLELEAAQANNGQPAPTWNSNTGVIQPRSAPTQSNSDYAVVGSASFQQNADHWLSLFGYLNSPFPAEANPLFPTNTNNYNGYSANPAYAAPMAPMRSHDPAFEAAALEPAIAPSADAPAANGTPTPSSVVIDLTGDSPPRPAAIGANIPSTSSTSAQAFLSTGAGSNHFGLPPVPVNSPQAGILATPSALVPPPAASTPGTGTAVAASPALTPRAMGYPMQKDCMIKCGLPLEGLLTWRELSESEQQSAIDRLIQNAPNTTREFATYHLKTQMGKYKDEKKRQIKKMEERLRAASKAAKGTGEAGIGCAAEAAAVTTAEATGNEGVQTQMMGGQAPQGFVAPGIVAPGLVAPGLVAPGVVVPGGQASQMSVTGQGINVAPTLAAKNHQSQRHPSVLAGFKAQTPTTPAASPASAETPTPAAAAAAAATATPTPAPRRRGRPPGSKNRPAIPTTPGLIQPALGTAPAQVTGSPAAPSPGQLLPSFLSSSNPEQVLGPASPLGTPAQAPVDQAQSPDAQTPDPANTAIVVATPPTRGRPPRYGPPLPKYFRFRLPVDCDASVQKAPSAPAAAQQQTSNPATNVIPQKVPAAMPNAIQSLHSQQNDSALLASLASVGTGSWTAVNTPQRPATLQQLNSMRPPTSSFNTNASYIQGPVDTLMVGQPVVATNYQPAAADVGGQSIVTMFGMGMDIDDEEDVKVKVEEDSGDENRVKRRKLGDKGSEYA
ncbi:hypothetical protein FPQ18DRAFT_414186 [Pyronema domesticum]|nr:hypothetical protein FPQ18DRAFT_414186 [Pyronema domesticum]